MIWMGVVIALGLVPGTREISIGLGVLLLLLWAAIDLRLQGFVRVLRHVKVTNRYIALTFDDGPDAQTTPVVLDLLAQYGARATFFVIGEKAHAHPELLKRMVAEGHEVGAHGQRHRWTDFVRIHTATNSLRSCADHIKRATGIAPYLFRPPYGVTVPAMGCAIAQAGYTVVGWSIRTKDALGIGDPLALAKRTLHRLAPGDVVLLHDAPQTEHSPRPLGPDMLGVLLDGLQKNKFQAVTVSSLLGCGEQGETDGETSHTGG